MRNQQQRRIFAQVASRCYAYVTRPASVPLPLKKSQILHDTKILPAVDKILQLQKPPAIELFYVEPYSTRLPSVLHFYRQFDKNLSFNPYGHAAIRYVHNDQQYCMNIVGAPGKRMVNFLQPHEYLFGDPSIYETHGAEQGGVHYRSIIGFRIEEWPAEYIEKMHHYYLDLQKREEAQLVKYSALFGTMTGYNILVNQLFKPFEWFSEQGNCSYWTTKGMAQAFLFKRATMWPKYGCVKLYLNMLYLGFRENINIVSYRQRRHGNLPHQVPIRGWMKPFEWFNHELFGDFDALANVVVDLNMSHEDEKTQYYEAVPQLVSNPHRPLWKLSEKLIRNKIPGYE